LGARNSMYTPREVKASPASTSTSTAWYISCVISCN
jgi:hypothetical protein